MASYLLESPHTDAECLRALDEISAGTRGPELLKKMHFGCMAGVHTGWAVVEADSEVAARDLLPAFLRSRAKAVKVGLFTKEQIKGFHKK
jgi:hypothetical protein